jgi:hypothetical protein
VAEPGEDTCLTCRHPDHDDEGCGALIGSGRYGSDGIEVPAHCRCTGWTPPGGTVTPDPWMDPHHPDLIPPF